MFTAFNCKFFIQTEQKPMYTVKLKETEERQSEQRKAHWKEMLCNALDGAKEWVIDVYPDTLYPTHLIYKLRVKA